jgi:hypothetical protein
MFFDVETSLEISFDFLLEVKNIIPKEKTASPNKPTTRKKNNSVKKSKIQIYKIQD